jgi:hypothetical protein
MLSHHPQSCDVPFRTHHVLQGFAEDVQDAPRAPRVPLADLHFFPRRALQDAPRAPRVPLADLTDW